MKVTFTEDDRAETFDVHRIERRSSCKPHFHGLPGLLVHGQETGRKGGGVVCYDEIVRSQKLDERSARNVNQFTVANRLREVLRLLDAVLLNQRLS